MRFSFFFLQGCDAHGSLLRMNRNPYFGGRSEIREKSTSLVYRYDWIILIVSRPHSTVIASICSSFFFRLPTDRQIGLSYDV
ncbi:MAG: hypothetical protein DMF61_01440 [Blastocatellia bacterium AA13]|nr:MAG: hypothetical protein DMF61_01440 [Blastocatellia bacterium AA13]